MVSTFFYRFQFEQIVFQHFHVIFKKQSLERLSALPGGCWQGSEPDSLLIRRPERPALKQSSEIVLYLHDSKWHGTRSSSFHGHDHASSGCRFQRARFFKLLRSPGIDFKGINSINLCSLAGLSYSPIPTQFLAPIDCVKIPALR